MIREEPGRLVDNTICRQTGSSEVGIREDIVQPSIRPHLFIRTQWSGESPNEGFALAVNEVHKPGFLKIFQVSIIKLTVTKIFPFRTYIQPLEEWDHIVSLIVCRLVVW